MGWGPVTSIGTIEGAAASISITPSAAVPAGALIVVGIQDENSTAIRSSQLTDSAGNTYTIAFSTTGGTFAGFAAFYSTNANGLSTSGTLTYATNGAAQFSAMTAAYSSNSLGFILDSGVTKTAAGNSANPTVTSNAPAVGGELFIGFACEDSNILTLTQDSGHGWAFPPNDVGAASGLGDLIGGNKVVATVAAQTFSPGSTSVVTWIAGIIGFQQVQVMSFYQDLSIPPRPRPVSAAQLFEDANANYYAIPGVQLLDYFPALSEPVRKQPPLPIGAPPFMAMQINYVQYSFSLIEAFDKATITIQAFSNINAAQVVITEIPTQTSQVTIQEIKFTRGYS